MTDDPYDPYDMGRRIAEARSLLRELGRLVCDSCAGHPTVAVSYVWSDGTRYLWLPAHRATNAETGGQDRVPAKAIPFHNQPDGSPHHELASCPRCSRVFLLMIDVDGDTVRFIKAGHPTRAQIRDEQ